MVSVVEVTEVVDSLMGLCRCRGSLLWIVQIAYIQKTAQYMHSKHVFNVLWPMNSQLARNAFEGLSWCDFAIKQVGPHVAILHEAVNLYVYSFSSWIGSAYDTHKGI